MFSTCSVRVYYAYRVCKSSENKKITKLINLLVSERQKFQHDQKRGVVVGFFSENGQPKRANTAHTRFGIRYDTIWLCVILSLLIYFQEL